MNESSSTCSPPRKSVEIIVNHLAEVSLPVGAWARVGDNYSRQRNDWHGEGTENNELTCRLFNIRVFWVRVWIFCAKLPVRIFIFFEAQECPWNSRNIEGTPHLNWEFVAKGLSTKYERTMGANNTSIQQYKLIWSTCLLRPLDDWLVTMVIEKQSMLTMVYDYLFWVLYLKTKKAILKATMDWGYSWEMPWSCMLETPVKVRIHPSSLIFIVSTAWGTLVWSNRKSTSIG